MRIELTQEYVDAKLRASKEFFTSLRERPIRMNDSERELFVFDCGFNRGVNLAAAKIAKALEAGFDIARKGAEIGSDDWGPPFIEWASARKALREALDRLGCES